MILIATSLLVLTAWIVIAATRLPPLGGAPRLPASAPPGPWPEVAAIIPARNEEETVASVISAHLASNYRGAFHIVLVDDHSSDATQERAQTAAHGRGNFTLTEAPPLPAGWTGKLWAVNAGLAEAARRAPGARYILLTDADIILAPQTLGRLVALAEENDPALTSLMARLDARGVWGGLLIPAFVYFFQKLYPFGAVNNPERKTAAAAGGCILLRRDALDAIGGVAAIRGRLIDDCALAAAVKATGRKIWIGLAKDEAISLRDNRSLASIWSMVARSAFAQLGHSWVMLGGTIGGMLFLYLAAPAIALSYPAHGNGPAAAIAAAAWALMAATYLPTTRVYDQAPWRTFLLPAAALLFTLMTISSAIDHLRGRGGAWKGRTYLGGSSD